jgi:hypothetical protein
MSMPFAALPRELIDHIITESIFLQDPVHQWTRFRFITRYHQSVVEQHFRDFWIPKLSFTISMNDDHIDNWVIFAPSEENSARFEKEQGHGGSEFVTFAANHDHEDLVAGLDRSLETWLSHVTRSDATGNKAIVVRLGEGTLNNGFTRGGIVSDVAVPGIALNVETDPWQLSFDWKALFTQLFAEEVLLQRFRDKLLDGFMPETDAKMTWVERQTAVYEFLRDRHQGQRRAMLAAYREHIAHHSGGPSHIPRALSFDMTPYLHDPPSDHASQVFSDDFDSVVSNLCGEQSIVFQMPGWETWSIRQLARMRILDELLQEEDEEYFYSLNQGVSFYHQEYRRRQEAMLGEREVPEELLEDYLRGPALDTTRFLDV